MARKLKRSYKLHTKLKPLYAAMLPLMAFGVSHSAMAAVIDYADTEDKAGAIALTDNSTQLQVTTGSATQSGVISGAFNIQKIGAGSLTLSGANTYSGATNVSHGTLILGNASALGTSSSVSVQNATGPAVLDLGGFSFSVDNLIVNAATPGVLENGTMNVSSLTQIGRSNISAVLAGTGIVRKALTYTSTLSAVNTYTGATEVNDGTLRISSTGSILTTSGITINGGNLEVDGAGGNAIADTLAITNTTGTFTLAGSDETIGSISGAGNINLNGNTLTAGGDGTSTTLSGVISGTGALTKQGAGTFTLSGTNTYTGATTINAGILRASNASALGNNSAVTVGGGSLDLTTSLGIGSLAGAGNVTLNANTLTTGGNNTSTSYSGVMSGTGALIKQGTGTQTLTGMNTYSGGTTISAGVVAINNGNALGSGDITVSGGELLATQSLTLSPSSLITGNGTTNTFSAVTGATLTLAPDNLAFGSNQNLIFGSSGNGGTVEIAPTIALSLGFPAGSLTVNNGTLRSMADALMAAANYFTATTVAAGATLDFNDHDFATYAILNLQGAGIVSTGSATATDIGIQAGNFSGSIQGAGKITKTTTGTLVLSGANTYSGGTTISDGTLQIGSGGTTGSIAGDVTNNASLVFNRSNALTYAGVISGTGSMTQAGAGTLTLTGTNTYTGGTTISAGTLQLGNGGTTGSIAGDVVNNASLVFNRSNALTYAGVISGTGSVTQAGTGTTTLSGANTYTGDTIISDGTLQLGASNRIADTSDLLINGGTFDLNDFDEGVANLSGSGGVIDIGGAGNTTLTVNQTVDGTYAGDFTGNSNLLNIALVKNGAATLTLSGTSTQTGTAGGVTINAGRLAVSGGNAIADSYSVRGAGEFELLSDETIAYLRMDVGGNVLLNGNTLTLNTLSGILAGDDAIISGAGNIIIGGAGQQSFSGANTYTGSTTINSGELIADNLSALGNDSTVTVNSGGELRLSANLAIGSLAGDGAVNLSSRSLTSGGDNTSTTFSGVLSGAGGSLNKTGTGNLNLTGINTYTGATTINGGILSVNGSIASSATTVNAGGTLGGAGTVGNVTINGGTIAPGNSIGTLNVAGNVDFSAGGTYAVEVNAAGASDRINATGTATLTNGTVSVIPEAGDYNLNTDYTILTAAGGLGGTTFNSVSSNLAFLTPTLSYDANNVFLNLRRNDVSFSAVAGTPNQTAVSTVIDELSTSNPEGIEEILDNLFILTADGANQAYDSLSGVQHTHGNHIALQSINQFKGLLFDRIQGNNQFLAHDGKLMLAYNEADTMTDAGASLIDGNVSPQRGWWLRGTGNYGDIDDTRNASGAHYKAGGMAAGIDFDLDGKLTLGGAFGYTRTDADVANGGLDVDSYQAALYGRLTLRDDYYLSGMTGVGFHDMKANRQVTVGLLSNTAEADYDAWTGNVAIEGGRKLTFNSNTSITPFAGLEYAHINRDSFTEKDGGVANLKVKQDKQDSLRSAIGARLTHSWSTNGYRITPTAELAWIHEFMETEASVRAGFATVPTANFSVDGPELDRDRARLALGLNVQLTNTAHLNLGYQGEYAGSDERHDIAATFRMEW